MPAEATATGPGEAPSAARCKVHPKVMQRGQPQLECRHLHGDTDAVACERRQAVPSETQARAHLQTCRQRSIAGFAAEVDLHALVSCAVPAARDRIVSPETRGPLEARALVAQRLRPFVWPWTDNSPERRRCRQSQPGRLEHGPTMRPNRFACARCSWFSAAKKPGNPFGLLLDTFCEGIHVQDRQRCHRHRVCVGSADFVGRRPCTCRAVLFSPRAFRQMTGRSVVGG